MLQVWVRKPREKKSHDRDMRTDWRMILKLDLEILAMKKQTGLNLLRELCNDELL
jgi:hypothetical protein